MNEWGKRWGGRAEWAILLGEPGDAGGLSNKQEPCRAKAKFFRYCIAYCEDCRVCVAFCDVICEVRARARQWYPVQVGI